MEKESESTTEKKEKRMRNVSFLMEKKILIKVFRPFKATINQPRDFSLWYFMLLSIFVKPLPVN